MKEIMPVPKKENISIREYRGTLHAHTGTPREVEAEDVHLKKFSETYKGSNCAFIPMDLLVMDHAKHLKNDYIAITNHSREADPANQLERMKNWLFDSYVSRVAKKEIGELSKIELQEINKKVKDAATKIVHYGDERLEEVLRDIELMRGNYEGFKIFKGIEANLMPDGSFDSELIEKGKFDMVNCSIHPTPGNHEFEELIKDPQAYTELLVKGIQNHRTNIMCHIGFGCKDEFTEKLDWDRIAKEAIKNQVAIEINLAWVMHHIFTELPKHKNNNKFITDLLNKHMPILVRSDKIKEKLKLYFEKGLKIAINTDEHQDPYILDHNDQVRDFSYWKAIKLIEKYLNSFFEETGVKRDNIINTYPVERLEKFFSKIETKDSTPIY